jgi:hypothetical protein
MSDPAAPLDSITQVDEGHRGAFVIVRDGKRLAELAYTGGGPVVIIDHTDVDDALRGTGAGKRLVEAAVAWARTAKKQVVPLCPFAKSVFEKRPDLQDVLAP